MKSSRRQLIRSVGAAAFAGSGMSAQSSSSFGDYQVFWGDLHNHNSVGYARGSLERSYEIAREHLDFYAFTPHAQWHDMPEMPSKAHEKWVEGFKATQDQWPRVQKMAAEFNEKDKFASILAYEWHSSHFGDYCLYYPGDNLPLEYADSVKSLQKHAIDAEALIIPHHLAYRQGWRGANWDFLDTSVSPVLEIFSEHGLSEHDRASKPFIRHSNGGRWSRNTLQAALNRGFRAGVIGSSDDHLGYPGAYGQGLAGIFAKELSREAVLDAIRARRTFAVTGDRISLAAKLNGQWMGSDLPFDRDREIEVSVRAQDEIQSIEILRNDRVLHRYFPGDHTTSANAWGGEGLCRLEFGWGPWADLDLSRVCDWDVTVSTNAGEILSVTPCFQSGPFEEDRRDRIVERKERSCRFQLHTSRRQAYEEIPTKGLILHLAGGLDTVLELNIKKPVSIQFRRTLGELAEHNEVEFTGQFTSESFMIHRLVTPDLFNAKISYHDKGEEGEMNWYYVRVTQANGHQAWSSPFWVGGR